MRTWWRAHFFAYGTSEKRVGFQLHGVLAFVFVFRFKFSSIFSSFFLCRSFPSLFSSFFVLFLFLLLSPLHAHSISPDSLYAFFSSSGSLRFWVEQNVSIFVKTYYLWRKDLEINSVWGDNARFFRKRARILPFLTLLSMGMNGTMVTCLSTGNFDNVWCFIQSFRYLSTLVDQLFLHCPAWSWNLTYNIQWTVYCVQHDDNRFWHLFSSLRNS